MINKKREQYRLVAVRGLILQSVMVDIIDQKVHQQKMRMKLHFMDVDGVLNRPSTTRW